MGVPGTPFPPRRPCSLSMLHHDRLNAIQVCNLPDGARQVDLTILVSKTHIRPFLRDYWLDADTNVGHLLLRKEQYMSFVLFVLKKHFRQVDEIPYCCLPERVDDSARRSRDHFLRDPFDEIDEELRDFTVIIILT